MQEACETVIVEFYGVPRLRAGRESLAVRAGTITDTLRAVEEECPGLKPLLNPDGSVIRHYLLSLNGNGFIEAMHGELRAGDRILLMSADAGG